MVILEDITELQQQQEELRRSEEQYRELVENINDILYATDEKGVITYISRVIEYSTGLSSSEIIGHPFAEFIHPEDLPRMIESFRQSAAGHASPSEFRIFDKSGKTHWLRKSSKPVFYGDRFAGTRGLLTDITERKQADIALRESEERYRQMFEKNRSIKLLIDPQSGRIVDANPAACEFYGFPLQEFKTKRIMEINTLPEERVKEEMACAVSERRNYFVFRHRLASGEIRDVEVHSSPVDIQGRKVIYSIIYDITQRKRAEEALKQSERDYRELFEQAHDAILIISPESEVVLDVNHRACEIYGFDRTEFIGMSLETISKDIPRGQLRIKETLEKGDYLNFETVQYRQDGTKMFLEINAAVVDYKGKRAILSVNRDVTDRKRAEEMRSQLLQRLVTTQEDERRRLSRELHDQMGQSLAALMLGLKSLENSVEIHSQASVSLKKLQGLTNELAQEAHTLARDLRPSALDDFGLHTAVLNYVEEWSERSQIAVDFHSNGLIKERLPPHIETAVYRIVQEALTNVLKHAEARNVSVIVENRGNRVLTIVEDDGCGFDAEGRASKPSGKGRLGLLGMEERVVLAGGKFNIESTPGAGTTVLAHIPITSNQLEMEQP